MFQAFFTFTLFNLALQAMASFYILFTFLLSLFCVIHSNHGYLNRRKGMRESFNVDQSDNFESLREIALRDYYMHILNDDDDYDSISREMYQYSDKSQQTAFLLSLFLGSMGAGRFYCGDIDGAILKLLVFLLIIILTFMIISCYLKPEWSDRLGGEGPILLIICIYCVLFFGLIINILVDIILFAMNAIPDEDGLPLRPMNGSM